MTKMVIVTPSNHKVTANITDVASAELQIYHYLVSSTNEEKTNQRIPVKNLVVSILFSLADRENPLLAQLGISSLFLSRIQPK